MGFIEGIVDVGNTVGVVVGLALGSVDEGQTLLSKDGRKVGVNVGQPVCKAIGFLVDCRLGFFVLGFAVGLRVGLVVDVIVGHPVRP